MNTIEATTRNTNTKGEINSLRIKGQIPAIVYGGSEKNKKISLNKKNIKTLLEKENFLSNIISLTVDGKLENVLPKHLLNKAKEIVTPWIDEQIEEWYSKSLIKR